MANSTEIESTLLLLSTVGIVLVGAMVFIAYVFYKRKANFLKEKKEAQQRYVEELIKSQVEIREETLRRISWELHDNIAQLMTLAKIKVHMLKLDSNEEKENQIESEKIIGKALEELRALSRSINPENLKEKGLIPAIKNEVERYNQLNFIQVNFSLQGEPFYIAPQEEIILFRMIQESVSNTLKHAKATQIQIQFNFQPKKLKIKVKDNGIGFDMNKKFNGIGLKNIKSRAELIGAKCHLISQLNKGTELRITYPQKTEKFTS